MADSILDSPKAKAIAAEFAKAVNSRIDASNKRIHQAVTGDVNDPATRDALLGAGADLGASTYGRSIGAARNPGGMNPAYKAPIAPETVTEGNLVPGSPEHQAYLQNKFSQTYGDEPIDTTYTGYYKNSGETETPTANVKYADGGDVEPEDQDPQSAMAGKGFSQIGQAVGNSLKNQYNEGQERLRAASGPVSDPATREALLGLGQQAAMSTVGEGPKAPEAGLVRSADDKLAQAMAQGVEKTPELPEGYRFEHDPEDVHFPHRVYNEQGKIAGIGKSPEAALADAVRVSRHPTTSSIPEEPSAHLRYNYGATSNNWGTPNIESAIKPGVVELDKITSVNPQANRLSPSAEMTLKQVADKDLVFGDPGEYSQSFIAKDENNNPIGHLGLDSNKHTQSIKVAPEARGQGIAGELYEKAVNKNGVIRSAPLNQQLPGGRALWASKQKQYPNEIVQARDPETLKPLDYKVWQRSPAPDPKLRAKEAAIQDQLDLLRQEPLINVSPSVSGEYVKYAKLKKAEEDLIQQHKDLNKKSGHTLFAGGGIVDHHNIHHYADGGDVSQGDSILDSPEAYAIAQGQQPQSQGQASILDSPQAHAIAQQDQYGGLGQQAIAGAEGAGQGLLGPIAPLAERAMGVSPEAIRGRAEANPGTHLTGEILGLAGPALLTGGASEAVSGAAQLAKFTQAGLLNKIAFEGGETLAGRVGSAMAKGAVDNMLIAGSDEASKAILNDPGQSAETIIPTILLSGALGGALGAGVGMVSEGWSKLNNGKASQVISDFKARIQDHANNPEPAKAIQSELEGLYGDVKNEPVWGKNGVKAEAIAKFMPEMSDKLVDHANNILEKGQAALRDLNGDPSQRLLLKEMTKYRTAIANSQDPVEMFNAAQELKQGLQGLANYEKLPTLAQKDFIDTIKPLAADIRQSLEDQKIWGQAGKVQKEINSNYSGFQKTIKNFQQTFMGDLNGTKVFDPNKLQTYINQVDKGKAGLKTNKLSNFLEEAQSYKAAIEDLYSKVGMDSPFEPTSINNSLATLKQKTTGAKLADAFIAKGLTEAGGKTVGAGFGAMLGSLVGHGELGAIIGGHALGPFFSSVLPGIAKAVTESPVSGTGFKAASDYAVQVAKGIKLLNNSTAAVFKAGAEVLPSHLYPSVAQRDKLDEKLKEYQANPQAMMDNQSKSQLTHYMPNHSQALNQTAAMAVQYLNSLRPSRDKSSPLDSEPVLSTTQKSQYNASLDLINQPLIILDKIKSGTLTTSDLQAVSSVYPALYNSIKAKLTDQMINAVHDKDTIPYRTKIALSMFLAQPLDSTMAPLSILAAQPKPTAAPQPMGGGQAPKGVKSSPALQKMPDMAKTPGQAREQRQQLRR